MLAYGEAIFEPSGGLYKAVRYIGTIEDITRRKLAENALREAELRQRLAIDAARVAVWEIDLDTDELTTTPELNRMFGLPEMATPSARDLRSTFIPEDLSRVLDVRANAMASGGHFESEFRCRFPDGSVHWRLLRGEPVKRSVGDPPRRLIGLVIDVDERKRAEERQHLLLREVHHRVKNSLSVIQALANQTFAAGRADPEALESFRGRLMALAAATEVAVSSQGEPFRLRALLEEITKPYSSTRIAFTGDDVRLPARLNVPLALLIHELCTNAAKCGALSTTKGTVSIEWSVLDTLVELRWIERGGPLVPDRLDRNFGLRLILEVLPVEIGAVSVQPKPAGLEARISIRR